MTLQLTPFIWMDGNAKDVIRFYEKALEAKVLFTQTFGESPEDLGDLSEDAKGRLAHSVLKIGDADLFVADRLPGNHVQVGNQVTICMTTTDVEKSKQFYEALQHEGQVVLPLHEVHFSPAYGEVKDQFGVTFQIFTKRQ